MVHGVLHIEFCLTAIMAQVNCSVLNRASNKTVFPWSISVESGVTVQQFCDEKIRYASKNCSKNDPFCLHCTATAFS